MRNRKVNWTGLIVVLVLVLVGASIGSVAGWIGHIQFGSAVQAFFDRLDSTEGADVKYVDGAYSPEHGYLKVTGTKNTSKALKEYLDKNPGKYQLNGAYTVDNDGVYYHATKK